MNSKIFPFQYQQFIYAYRSANLQYRILSTNNSNNQLKSFVSSTLSHLPVLLINTLKLHFSHAHLISAYKHSRGRLQTSPPPQNDKKNYFELPTPTDSMGGQSAVAVAAAAVARLLLRLRACLGSGSCARGG